MAKKETNTKVQKIINRFEDACKDTELTERFDRFLRNDKILVDRFNKELNERDSLIKELEKIESLILSELEKEKLPSDLVIRRSDLRKQIGSMEENLIKLNEDIEHNKFLIDRYKVIQDKQLLLWFGILTDIDHFKGTFIDFKNKFGNIQF